MMQIYLSALTDTGVIRRHNEDNFIVSPDLNKDNWFLTEKPVVLSQKGSLLVVADGMGGTNAGEVASAIAVESVKKFFSSLKTNDAVGEAKAKDLLRKAILQAHEEILKHARSNSAYRGMGTTIIVAWVLNNSAVMAWCGDSRGYLYRPGEGLKIITKDHSLVWELVKTGRLTPEEADQHPDSNIITQSLGDHSSTPRPDFVVQPLQSKDILLLCSDGLNNMITTEIIARIVAQEKSLDKINKELIDAANNQGGHDNITAVLLQVSEGSAREEKKQPRSGFLTAFVLAVAVAVVLAIYMLQRRNKPNAEQVEIKVEIPKKTVVDTMPVKLAVDTTIHTVQPSIHEKNATLEQDSLPIVTKKVETISKIKTDTLAQINQRMKKIENLLSDWKKISEVLDSIQQHQSLRHIDTLKTGFLFDLINRQREFEEFIDKKKFMQKNADWKERRNSEAVKLYDQYNPRKLDEELDHARSKFDNIQKILKKIIGKV